MGVNRHTHTDAGIPITWWRSVGHSHNGFAVETFMDEVARTLGQDPFEFRRQRITPEPRHLAVLERAAALGNWGEALPNGRARGIALHRSFGTYVAQVVEASISAGEIHVHRVACVVDCGQVVKPDIKVEIIESSELPSGVGEPGLPPVIPALGNALFALTGKRQRALPLSA